MGSGSPEEGVDSKSAGVAQLAEHRFCKPKVVGSTPTASFWPRRLVRSRTRAFQARDTGSNPVGVIGVLWEIGARRSVNQVQSCSSAIMATCGALSVLQI